MMKKVQLWQISWLLLIGVSGVRAQLAEQSNTKPVTPTLGGSEFYPRPEESLNYEYNVGGEDRILHFHLEDPASKRPGQLYVRPPFYPEVNPNPIAGFSEVVQDWRISEDGMYEVKINLRIFGPELERFAKDVLIANAREIYYPQGSDRVEINDSTVRVNRWPIEYVIFQLVVNEEVLSTWRPDDSYSGEPRRIEAKFSMSILDFDKFKTESLTHPRGVKIRPFYTFHGRKTNFVAVELKTVSQVMQKIWADIYSKQNPPRVEEKDSSLPFRDRKPDPKKGEAIKERRWEVQPITQIDFAEMAKVVETNLYQEVRATHPDLLQFAQLPGKELMTRILDPAESISIADLEAAFPEFQAKLAEYLTPLLRSMGLASGVEEAEARSKSKGGSFLTKIAVPIKMVQAESAFGLNWRSAVEKNTGVTFAETETQGVYEPHEIRSYKLRASFEETNFSSSSVTYLSLPLGGNEYRQDSSVPIASTWKAFLTNVKKHEATAPYRFYEVGDVRISFSPVDLDRRFWAPADGNTKYPNEPSTPQSLRGQSVPNLQGMLVGGAQNPDEVGKAWKDGKFSVPPLPIDGTERDGDIHFDTGSEVIWSFTPPGQRETHASAPWDQVLMAGNGTVPSDAQHRKPMMDGRAGIRQVSVLTSAKTQGLKNANTKGPHPYAKEDCEKLGFYPPHVRARVWVLIRPLPVLDSCTD